PRAVAELCVRLPGLSTRHARGARDPDRGTDAEAERSLLQCESAADMRAGTGTQAPAPEATAEEVPKPRRRLLRLPAGTLARSLIITASVGVLLYALSLALDPFNNLRLATVAYYFTALAGLTVLTGLNGQ